MIRSFIPSLLTYGLIDFSAWHRFVCFKTTKEPYTARITQIEIITFTYLMNKAIPLRHLGGSHCFCFTVYSYCMTVFKFFLNLIWKSRFSFSFTDFPYAYFVFNNILWFFPKKSFNAKFSQCFV